MTTSKTQNIYGVRPFVVYNYEEGKDREPTASDKTINEAVGKDSILYFGDEAVKINSCVTLQGPFSENWRIFGSTCYYYTPYAVVDCGEDEPIKVIDYRLISIAPPNKGGRSYA